jgi:hypothetical protein
MSFMSILDFPARLQDISGMSEFFVHFFVLSNVYSRSFLKTFPVRKCSCRIRVFVHVFSCGKSRDCHVFCCRGRVVDQQMGSDFGCMDKHVFFSSVGGGCWVQKTMALHSASEMHNYCFSEHWSDQTWNASLSPPKCFSLLLDRPR